MAFLVFVLTMVLLYGGTVVLSAIFVAISFALEGELGMDAIFYFMEWGANLFSCIVYMLPAAVFLPWYYFAFVEKAGIRQTLRAHTRRLSPICFVWVAVLGFAVQHATSLLMVFMDFMMPSAMNDYAELVENSGLTQYSLLWVIATLILPPLVEEVIFRGLILQYLGKAGASFLMANLIQAVLFGIFHMNLIQGVYTCLLGFLLGYLAYRYDSILVPMALHFVYNLFGTVLVDLENRFLPDTILGLLVLASVPLLVNVLIAIHFGVGEKKRERGRGL